MTNAMFVRRAHMYAGLFLAPWVLTFGVSALIIHNRPLLSGWPQRADVPDSALRVINSAALPAPQDVARNVITALNARDNTGEYTLVEDSIAYDGFCSMPLNWKSSDGKITFDPHAATGLITRLPPSSPSRRIAGAVPAAVTPPELATLQSSLAAALKQTDPNVEIAGKLSLPAVKFTVLQGGRLTTVRCDLLSGDVVLTDSLPTPYWEFLHKLHMTHKYFDGPWYRWTWLVMANLVGATLCFWVFSGLVMWWQSKAARRPGLVVLGLTMALVIAVCSGMWRLIAV